MQLLREFASLSRVTPEDLERLIQPRSTNAPAYRNPGRAKEAAPIAGSHERSLLRCVLAKPGLAAGLDDALLEPERLETGALRAIAELRADDTTSAAMLIEHFQGTEYEDVIAQVMAAAIEQDLDAMSAEHDFAQILLALRIKQMNQEIENLKARVNADPRLGQRLNVLVKELGQLKNQRASPSP
jgi:hypothetical protein